MNLKVIVNRVIYTGPLMDPMLLTSYKYANKWITVLVIYMDTTNKIQRSNFYQDICTVHAYRKWSK